VCVKDTKSPYDDFEDDEDVLDGLEEEDEEDEEDEDVLDGLEEEDEEDEEDEDVLDDFPTHCAMPLRFGSAPGANRNVTMPSAYEITRPPATNMASVTLRLSCTCSRVRWCAWAPMRERVVTTALPTDGSSDQANVFHRVLLWAGMDFPSGPFGYVLGNAVNRKKFHTRAVTSMPHRVTRVTRTNGFSDARPSSRERTMPRPALMQAREGTRFTAAATAADFIDGAHDGSSRCI
jgi:hypothetical protein